MKRILFVLMIASIMMASGCTGSSDSGAQSVTGEYARESALPTDRPEGMPDMGDPGKNITRPDRPSFEEPTEDELAETENIFASEDADEIKTYCEENRMLCGYYCMQEDPDNENCNDIMPDRKDRMIPENE